MSPTRHPIRVVAAGRIEGSDARVKGFNLTVEIAKELNNQLAEANGEWFLVSAMGVSQKESIDMPGLFEAVEMKSQSDLFDLMEDASITLLPSLTEAYGLVASESLSMGRPALVSATSGIADVYFGHNAADWVLPPFVDNAAEMWAHRISEICNSEESWRAASERAMDLGTTALKQ